jgi:hypothetical protein
MNITQKSRTLPRLSLPSVVLGLTGLLLACYPAVSAALPFVSDQPSSISGTVLAGSGIGLGGVVITLEPLDVSEEVVNEVKRVQTEQATVINQGGRFVPDIVVVSVGTTASLRSGDGMFHGAQLSHAGKWSTRLALPANGLEHRFTVPGPPGIVALRDWTNPAGETTHIIVVENRHFGVSDSQGRFIIGGIAPGTYTLRAWHKDLGLRTFGVTIAGAKETKVEFVFQGPKIAASR